MYMTIVKIGVVFATIASVAGVWIMFEFPVPATSTRVDHVEAGSLDTTILLLEQKVDGLALRKSRFDGIPRTLSITEQVHRLERQQKTFQKQLDKANMERGKLP